MTNSLAVLVPADRVGAFEEALGGFFSSATLEPPEAGSDGKDWTEVTVVVPEEKVGSFYSAFGAWVGAATAKSAEPVLPALTVEELIDEWDSMPRVERELLKLLADDGGRTVGWDELATKFGVAGPVDLNSALPYFSHLCESLDRSIPIKQVGDEDTAAFRLPISFLDRLAMQRL